MLSHVEVRPLPQDISDFRKSQFIRGCEDLYNHRLISQMDRIRENVIGQGGRDSEIYFQVPEDMYQDASLTLSWKQSDPSLETEMRYVISATITNTGEVVIAHSYDDPLPEEQLSLDIPLNMKEVPCQSDPQDSNLIFSKLKQARDNAKLINFVQ